VGLEAYAENQDEQATLDQQKSQDDQAKREKDNQSNQRFNNSTDRNLTEEDHKAIGQGKSIRQVRLESDKIKDQAEEMITLAEQERKMTDKEAAELRKQLLLTQNKDAREQILESVQKRVAQVETSGDKDRFEELPEQDQDRLKLERNYVSLLKEHAPILGEKQLEEYEKWIKEQPQTIDNLEKQTVALLQSELPPRREVYNDLKKTLVKYGIQSPMDVPYLAREGLSERTAFLKNIKKLEGHFDEQKDMKANMYSEDAKKEIMKNFCQAENPQEQEFALKKMEKLITAENNGFAELGKAVLEERFSKKSMEEMLAYYKGLGKINKRFDNVDLWNGFIENEAKLGDKLKEVFDKEPKNEEGYKIAFNIFKDLNYAEKEAFIKDQKTTRKKNKTIEEQHRDLQIKETKHEISKARIAKTISEKTEKRFLETIDKKTEGKSYKEVKELHEALMSKIPQEDKEKRNLVAYELKRKKFKEDLRIYTNLNPQISEKEIKKWQEDYDESTWEDREEKHKELTNEIKKSTESDTKGKFGSLDKKTLNEMKETEGKAEKNKQNAMGAIRSLLKLKAYGTAMKRCALLLNDNPGDEELGNLLEEIEAFANMRAISPDLDEEQDLYEQYKDIAGKEIAEDSTIKDETEAIQTEGIALDLMSENIQRHNNSLKTAKQRSAKEVDEQTRGEEDVNELAEEYMEDSEDNKVLDKKTMKGRDAIQIDVERPQTKLEQTALRKKVQKEQIKKDRGGSEVTEFKDRRLGRVLEKREAQGLHDKRKERLAEKMVADIVSIISPDRTPSPEQLALAREAALEKINEKEETRIEQMAA